MNFDERIDQLAATSESDSPVVSLYLDTAGGDGAQRDRVRIMTKHELQRLRDALDGSQSRLDAESVEEAVQRVEEFLRDQIEPSTRGVAVFARADGSLFEAIELTIPVRSELFIGSRPHVRQLFEIREERPRLLVALVDTRSARICEIEIGAVAREETLTNEWNDRSEDEETLSPSQQEDHLRHFLRDVATRLDELVRRVDPQGVILSAQEKTRALLQDALTQPVSQLLLDPLHLDIRSSHDEVIEKCESHWHLQNETLLYGEVDQLEALAGGDGRAAVGFTSVIRAANERRLDRILITDEANGRGWKCPNCSMFGEKIPLGCPSCGSDVVTVDLIEQLISAARSERAGVKMPKKSAVLGRHDGVAAFLRF